MAIRYVMLLMAALGLMGTGCSTSKIAHDADYVDLSYTAERALSATPEETVNPVVSHLAGAHPVEEYIQVALAQNPEIQAARKRLEAAGYQVPVAASLQDPMLNLTVQPAPVQTAAGEQRTTLSANQKFPWFGKLDRRGSQAEAQTDVHRAELAATELAVMEQVQRAYYELYF
ncbi:MAG: TolC family protein, partial [Planctomycetaceae bacterium]|nr:TolC family protein [Planctomycetaceae bacterium]